MGRGSRFFARTLGAASVVFFCLGGFAHAGPKEDLEKAEQLYGSLNYDEANKVAVSVTKQRGLTHDQLVRAYRIAAVTHAILDHEDPSRDAFIMLLTYDADFQADPNLGPKVTTPFFEARGFWRSQSQKPGIDATASVKAREGGTIRIVVRDPSHIVKKAQAGYRWGATGEFKTRPISAGDPTTLEVPAAPPGTTRLDYFVQANDDKDNVVLESGNPQTPKTVTVETPPPVVAGGGGEKPSKGGFVGSAGFWGILAGVAVVGGGAAIFAVTRPKDEPSTVSLSPALKCGGDRCN